MRKLIVIALFSVAAACGSKKAPANPSNSNTQTEATPAGSAAGSDATTEGAAPGGGGGSDMKSADPCEGGE